ncbi:MAG: Planctomycete cytochrome, partial [Armatimonadetes bacterium]|nr:Planctomycete cytochrome [Armatimonadota bacterium]
APDAYEKVVDRLLASPHYGERWARYWLDLVRYADSNGYERDAEKPHSWKYRDYVIRALNEDRPYNRFVMEQLAGDELPSRSEETVAATGFLRVGTWDDEPNDPLEYKYERLDDLVHAAGTTFLGLTVKCARCHDHKFDPIPQKDYYGFAAAFYAGYLEPGDGKLLGGPPAERLGVQALGFTDRGPTAPPLRLLKNGDARYPEAEVGPGFLSAIGPLGHQIAPPAPDAVTTGRRRQLAEWIVDSRNPLTARVLVNRIWQHHFGEGIVRSPNNFGRTGDLPTHPELLDWLAATFVSGNGETGKRGNGGNADPISAAPHSRISPTKPWSLKSLHRLILLSSTYRMASVHPRQAAYAQQDFGNMLLWRQNRRRLDADALRDAMLTVSGELNPAMGGRGFVPTVSSEALEGLSRKGAEWMPSPTDEQRRRTIYMFLKRALLMPLLTTFDFGDTTAPLGQRDVTIVPTQALTLLNNDFVHQRANGLAALVEARAAGSRVQEAEQAWRLALGRAPTAAERAAAVAHLTSTEAAAEQERRKPIRETELPTGARLWLRADRDVTTDADGRVQRWTDPSTGIAALPPAPDTAPLLVKDALSGRPALRFDGKARYLHLPEGLVTSQQFTILAVANDRETGGGPREIFSNWRPDNSTTSLFLGTTGAGQIRLSDAATLGTLATPSRHFVLTAVSDRAGASVYQNRRELARKNGPLPARNLSGRYVIGQQGNIQGEYWNGDLAELLVFDRALSAEELERLWDWTSQRYELGAAPSPRHQALTSLCRVLLNTNEFCFVD